MDASALQPVDAVDAKAIDPENWLGGVQWGEIKALTRYAFDEPALAHVWGPPEGTALRHWTFSAMTDFMDTGELLSWRCAGRYPARPRGGNDRG